ncbi:MAG TPA: transposase [Armatimonadota bacterium]
MIEQAYTLGELVGLPVWCEDEAGPFQAMPQPGESWALEGNPSTQPHESIRGGTAKLLTLFHPATGEVQARPVSQTTNAILHPWLKGALTDLLTAKAPTMLTALPPPSSAAILPQGEAAQEFWKSWDAWGWPSERLTQYTTTPACAIRLLLVLDNLKGHYTKAFVAWCLEHGIALLYTPLGSSWLNMAEAIQRILVRRAVTGQHYPSAEKLQDALTAVIRGWNHDPTPFSWGGKRRERRRRAKERRHTLGGARVYTRRPVTGRRKKQLVEVENGIVHDK